MSFTIEISALRAALGFVKRMRSLPIAKGVALLGSRRPCCWASSEKAKFRPRVKRGGLQRRQVLSSATHSLCGSASHFGSLSCWHIEFGLGSVPRLRHARRNEPFEYSNSRNSWPCMP